MAPETSDLKSDISSLGHKGWNENAAIGAGLAISVRHAGASVLVQDENLRIIWVLNAPSLWRQNLVGLRDADFLPEGEAVRLSELKRQALHDGQPAFCELSIATPSPHWFNVWIDPFKDNEGNIRTISTTMVEITEQKQRERALHMLLREVSHRSKNLLAIIQSIATQTGRFSSSIDSFMTRFRGRLQSLAASQDLVTLSNWRGAQLRDLVSSQVERYLPRGRNAIDFQGPDLHLNPNAALHIGLALHELGANSLSYGALSRPDGSISVHAIIEQGVSGERNLSLDWSESIDVEDPESLEKGFGTLTLERVVPASLKGSATLALSDGILRYELQVPLSSVD